LATLVLDIETVGLDLDTLHESVRASLLRAAEREPTEEQRRQTEARIRDQTSLWPLTARIVAIAVVDAEGRHGRVYYESDEPDGFTTDDGVATCLGTPEREALRAFWEDARGCSRFVTFNGRSFDMPFLLLRSAFHGLRPSSDLMAEVHVDLLQKLSFEGATRRFSLDLYCRAFGLESPKDGGVSGADVAALHREGRYREIARYCLRDAIATAALYRRWRDTLCFDDSTSEEDP
jgi:hypothetical protein